MSFSWQDIWRLVKRWWWLAVIGVVLSGGTSYYFASQKPNIYAARTRLMVGSGIRNVDPNSQDFGLGVTLAQAYAEMAQQRPIAQGVVQRLELPIGWWELAGSIRTRVIPSAQLLEITVIHTDPEFAALAANAVAEELIRQSPASSQEEVDRDFVRRELANIQTKIQETQTQIDELRDNMVNLTSATELEDARTRLAELEQLRSIYNSSYVELANLLNIQSPNTLTVVEPASAPTDPIAPSPRKEAAMAAVAGLALAIGAALLLEFADDTLRIQDASAESLMGLPILGAVARMPGGRCEPRSPEAEMIRQLRTKVLLSAPATDGTQAVSGRLRSLLVTSSMSEDGKTVVAANLGVTMSGGGSRVVLIDADMRAPSLHEWFDHPNVAGLAELLSADSVQWEQMLPQLLHDTGVPGLSLLPAGRPPLDPSILLASPNMVALLEQLSSQFDLVLFDSPPVLATPDATILAMLAQSTLLVVSSGKASRRDTRRSIKKLRAREDTQIIGIALNRTPLSRYAYSYTRHEEMVPQPGYRARLPQRLGNIISSLPVIGRPADPDLISLSQAAIILGVRRNTVKRWRREGRLPAVRKNLRWWVRQSELQSTLLGDLVIGDASSLQGTNDTKGDFTSEDVRQLAVGSTNEPLGPEPTNLSSG